MNAVFAKNCKEINSLPWLKCSRHSDCGTVLHYEHLPQGKNPRSYATEIMIKKKKSKLVEWHHIPFSKSSHERSVPTERYFYH